MKVYNYRIKERVKKTGGNSKPFWRRFKFPFKLKRPKNFWVWLFRGFAIGVVFVALLFLYYTKDLPDPNKLLNREVPESTKIFDKDGQLLYEVHGEVKRTLVGLDQITDEAEKATIAIEDKDFYKHHGLYFKGIARSMVRYVVNLGPSGGGGSTLTQQFVKNAILANKDGIFGRKIPEAILSLELEAKFSKEDILKLYLNEIPYGRNAYGIEAAAESYFGKHASELTLAESAYLAALPQAPSYYNPLGPNREILDGRKDRVLTAMREQGYINEQQEKEAKAAEVEFLKTNTAISAPHFVMMVQDYLSSKYGEKTLQDGGLKVYTTLDSHLQKIAEEAVKQGVENNIKKYNGHNAALVAIDPKTGQILAMVGSRDYFEDAEPAGCSPKNCLFSPNVNAAVSELQPGSSFKPYVYVTAFGPDFKYAPATELVDVITNFGNFGGKDYVPGNYDGKERGPVSMRQALAGSLNIPAVKTLALVGVDKAVETARDLGITTPMADCNLSLVLGGCGVKLVDHVAAYSVLANGGVKNEKTAILKILDRDGNVLEEFRPNPKEVLDPQAVYQLTSIMTDNAARSYIFGANSPLILPGRTVAAKTGTTNKWHDGWTLGFTPSLAAGVWAGNNNGALLKAGADGVFVAAPIWHQFMQEALKDQPAENFQRPPGITTVVVDAVSGKLPTTNTPSTKEEIFASYNVPEDYDDVHLTLAYDSQTDQPADNQTPPDRIIYKAFTVLHSERRDSPNWEDPVREWAIKNGYLYPANENDVFQPGQPGGFQIKITDPADDSTINTSPFSVRVDTGANSIARVDLFIDGQFYQSKKDQPFNFEISKILPAGSHIIAAKATDVFGKSGDTSITINFGSSESLTLTDPSNDTLAVFPVSLAAESGKKLDGVKFYYQIGNNEPTTVEGNTKVENVGGKYRYSLTWNEKPDADSFQVFAKTAEGTETKKIKINTP